MPGECRGSLGSLNSPSRIREAFVGGGTPRGGGLPQGVKDKSGLAGRERSVGREDVRAEDVGRAIW